MCLAPVNSNSKLTVSVVVEQAELVLVESSSQMSLSHGQTDSIGETLTQRSRGNLDSISHPNLGVSRGNTVQLPKRLEVLHRDLVTHEVEHDVLERTGVTVGEDESVSVVPLGVFGGRLHDLSPEDVGD